MTRAELIHQLALRFSSLELKGVDLSVRVIFDAMSQALFDGGRIEVRGLSYQPPRLGRNPKTGSPVKIAGKYRPHFRAGLELRERVNSMKTQA